ncbi:MAG: NifB/NifX family molybdenum-iron cluster-binding protein [Deltaproteobacteria bacterium]|nr:NifB/NifX family molybdenum-iron cluster-binding protein [Deltaproteobacteria bacterium]MBW2097907.1 NifB/NifX family molybdenum-iron cluster-binding protein [Deltaproteobacteria bacterium]
MKLAISATGKDLDSMIDPSFGRANYFVIVDSESGNIVKVIDNTAAQDAAGGAGINAATIVAGSGAQTVLTGQVGPNAFEVLQADGIKVISNVSGTVREAVEQYRKGTISSPDEGPGVTVHPGQTTGGLGRGIAGGGRGMGGGGRGRGIAGGGRGMGGGGGMGRGMGKKPKR